MQKIVLVYYSNKKITGWLVVAMEKKGTSIKKVLTATSSGVAYFAIYPLICHFNLWRKLDKQYVRKDHFKNRFFTIASNGEKSKIDPSLGTIEAPAPSRLG